MTLDPGPVLTENQGEGGFDFADDAGTLSVRAKTGAIEQPIEMIVLGSDLYSRYPENSPKWYRQDWEGGLMQPGLAPAEWLDVLGAADDDDVSAEGREEVGDVSTARYVVDLSYEEIVEADDDELEDRLADLAPVVEFEPFEVWIDHEGLPRRLRVTASLEHSDSTIDFVGRSSSTTTEPTSRSSLPTSSRRARAGPPPSKEGGTAGTLGAHTPALGVPSRRAVGSRRTTAQAFADRGFLFTGEGRP